MLFNSLQFLLFFPLVTILYFAVPHRLRCPLLLIASCIFYMAWIPAYVLILFLIIGIDYVAAQKIEASTGPKRKAFLAISILANVGLLAVFKYYGFIAENLEQMFHLFNPAVHLPVLNLILPIGLSFHTFQALAYTIEVYRGNFKAEKNLLVYALYVMFYPQLVAGPIERPQHLIPQFKEEHTFDPKMVTSGLRLMLWGFFKKLMIADRLAILVNVVYSQPHNYSGVPLLLATYCFAYQIYCDFSGYTDIAIGAARVMGINLVRNFNSPYCADSIRDFWHRWHISLSTWFRDYLYIPLGGSRLGTFRTLLNILIVFFVSGLWHGANWTYAVWGLLHGIFMIVLIYWSKMAHHFPKVPALSPVLKFSNWFITFNAVCLSWIFFRANSTQDGFWIVQHLWPLDNGDKTLSLGLTSGEILVAIVSIFVLESVQFAERRFAGAAILDKLPLFPRWVAYYMLILGILILGEFGGARFIYFQF